MAKVTTGTGDTGYTGLLGEQRVPKYDPRPDTFGTVDEATSALGLARAMTSDPKVKEIIYQIQQELYMLMGELATTPENYEKMGLSMTIEHVQHLEQVEEHLKREVEIPNKFIIPGDTPVGAALDDPGQQRLNPGLGRVEALDGRREALVDGVLVHRDAHQIAENVIVFLRFHRASYAPTAIRRRGVSSSSSSPFPAR